MKGARGEMAILKLTIVGSGDAFGSGGRCHTCFHVEAGFGNFLIDIGASALPALNKSRIDLGDIDAIFISHLHGDHFAGLPFAELQAAYVERRNKPLTIFGPQGIKARYHALAEAMFPGMTTKSRPFDMSFEEMHAGQPNLWRGMSVEAFEVEHPSGAPSHALRFSAGGKILAYSGDTQWCDCLVSAGQDADLFLLECYGYDRDTPYHMNWAVIQKQLPRLRAKRVVLTHMSRRMLDSLAHLHGCGVEIAEDGLVLDI